ncbi:MAG: hypothetical protein ACXV9R_11080 [Methylobacter sp.]
MIIFSIIKTRVSKKMNKEVESGQEGWKTGAANQNQSTLLSLISIVLILALNPNLAFPRDYPAQPSMWKAAAGSGRTFTSGQAACAAACAEVFCTPPNIHFTWTGGIQIDAMNMVCAATYYDQPWGISAWTNPICPFGGSLKAQYTGAEPYPGHKAVSYMCINAPNCTAGTTSDPTTVECVNPCPAG